MRSLIVDDERLSAAAGASATGDDLTYEQAEAILRQIASSAAVDSLNSLDCGSVVPAGGLDEHGGASHAARPAEAAASTAWDKQTFQHLLESLPNAVVVTDRRGSIVLVNAQTEKLFGYGRGELLGMAAEFLVPTRFHQRLSAWLQAFAAKSDASAEAGAILDAVMDFSGLRKNGREFPAEIRFSSLVTGDGPLVISTISDITRRKRIEERYRTLVEGIPAVTFMAVFDEAINELYVSPQIEQLLGFSQQEWLEDPVLWHTRLHPEDRVRWHHEFAHTCATGTPFRSVYRFLARDGRVVWVQGEAKVVRDALGRPLFLQGMAYDITERKNAEDSLQRAYGELEHLVLRRTQELANTNGALQAEIDRRAAVQVSLSTTLKEKESLLKEIHHRVKNNLQVISSLLNLQSASVKDPEVLHALAECRNRVRSMALIHEKLYRSTDLARIDFRQYVRELGAYLFRSYGAQNIGVELHVEIDDASLCIDSAIPCGLIITELVSNCLNHAFRERPGGHVTVALHAAGERGWTLAVIDDGVGFPGHVDFRNTESLGLQLVNSLANQLDGTIRMQGRSGGGTAFELHFSEPKTRPET